MTLSVRQLQEKCREQSRPLCIAFIDVMCLWQFNMQINAAIIENSIYTIYRSILHIIAQISFQGQR